MNEEDKEDEIVAASSINEPVESTEAVLIRLKQGGGDGCMVTK